MTFQVGRVTLPNCPVSLVQDGDRLEFRFHLVASSGDQLDSLRHQLAGLVDDIDDPVVPVAWSDDPTVDGFYRVSSVSLPGDSLMLSNNLIMNGSLSLERIPGFASPVIEIDASAVVRTNACGATSSEPAAAAAAFHSSASTFDSLTSGGTLGVTRTGSDGDVTVVGQLAPFTRVTNAFPSIASRYSGACKLEVKYDATWYTAVGQQVPASAAGNWRISNSLVRFTYASYTGTSATVGGLQVEVYDGGAWRDTVTMKFGTWAGGVFTDAAWVGGDGIGSSTNAAGAVVACPVRVVRNSPETVTLGFYKANTGTQFVSLDMGAMFCTLTSRAIGAVEPMLRPVGTETAAGVGTGAIWSSDPARQRSSNDTNGNRYWIGYTQASTATTQNGGVRHGANISTGTAVTFGIGVVLDGSSAASGNSGLDLAEQYVGQAAWRQRVVVR
jgi:hypothetical protein